MGRTILARYGVWKQFCLDKLEQQKLNLRDRDCDAFQVMPGQGLPPRGAGERSLLFLAGLDLGLGGSLDSLSLSLELLGELPARLLHSFDNAILLK